MDDAWLLNVTCSARGLHRSFANKSMNEGVSLISIAKRLGHKTGNMRLRDGGLCQHGVEEQFEASLLRRRS